MSFQQAARDAAGLSRREKHDAKLLSDAKKLLTAEDGKFSFRVKELGERGLRWKMNGLDEAKGEAAVEDAEGNKMTVPLRNLVHAPLTTSSKQLPSSTVRPTPLIEDIVDPTTLQDQVAAVAEVISEDQTLEKATDESIEELLATVG